MLRLALTSGWDIFQAQKMAAAQGVELPEDFIEAAKGEGLRKSVLEIFFKLQVPIAFSPVVYPLPWNVNTQL